MSKMQQFRGTLHCGGSPFRQRNSLKTLSSLLSGYYRNCYWISVLCWSVLSCQHADQRPDTAPETIAAIETHSPLPDENYAVHPEEILKDDVSWNAYAYDQLQLSQDFTGLDADSNRIDKRAFLQQLMTGKLVAFRIRRVQGIPVYRLYKLNQDHDHIGSGAMELGYREMKNFQMEGELLPEFHFTDLNGQLYTNESVKGKLLVLKCWFIHCVACVQEFPDCNALVDAYKDRKDVLFVSLASDEKKELENFLKMRELRYAVIPETGPFMSDKLHITSYPTHILVGPDGKILKVVSAIGELKPFLKRAVDRL
ncbi:TlpA disulfide reductase family protein [Niabella sp.]|uniref:TlpA family protein disulfide reductase n=1 Tax=Niabella sp. TaxID=1962976 RepID=UPI00263963F5|nr:TlpA disulfide reductase family protein [Niabella sp.]